MTEPVKKTDGKPRVGDGTPGPGRPKGVPNKTTVAAKQAIHEAFEKMGGIPALCEWANRNDDNRKVFYSQIWPKIVPLQVGGDPDAPHTIEIVRRIVRVSDN